MTNSPTQELGAKCHGEGDLVGRDDQTNTQTDESEIIFIARYSPNRVWLKIVFGCIPLTLFIGAMLYGALKESESWFLVGYLTLMVLGLMKIVLDAIFFNGLVFYKDRVRKNWYLFGSRTLYYSRGSVVRLWAGRRPGEHRLWEVREDGTAVPMRLPIAYSGGLFSSDTAKKVERIMAYLSEDTTTSGGVFKKATLPREVVWGSDSPPQPEHSPWGYEKSAQIGRGYVPFGMNRG